jgi:hypothetical protein
MIEPDRWDTVSSAASEGTIVRGGSERISSNRLLDLLGVDANPALRQKIGKRNPPVLPVILQGQ